MKVIINVSVKIAQKYLHNITIFNTMVKNGILEKSFVMMRNTLK